MNDPDPLLSCSIFDQYGSHNLIPPFDVCEFSFTKVLYHIIRASIGLWRSLRGRLMPFIVVPSGAGSADIERLGTAEDFL